LQELSSLPDRQLRNT